MKLDDGNQIPASRRKPLQKFSKNDHEALADIFKKIGQKELTKQGLQELYNFKQQNPQADLEPFLAKSSKYFRDYIERGLKGIEQEVQSSGGKIQMGGNKFGSVLSDTNSSENQGGASTVPSSGGQQYSQYLDRLQKLRKQGGLDKNSDRPMQSAYRIAAVPTTSSDQRRLERHEYLEESEQPPNMNSRPVEPMEVEDIRKRLERIKQSAH